ncbi:hypothetical protein [Sphingomonas elodea]|jgi:hypothetical protein|uniref:hypothetical protein n=1 Tax=Sphingomonas elodea TaxID=179878 RepID=UPI0002630564|nr:hypothetical protein [Sphingomonas elodea]
MTSAVPPAPPAPAPSGARATLRIGKAVSLEASITTGGLLAVAAIVASAVLGSAAIVRATRRSPGTLPPPPSPAG